MIFWWAYSLYTITSLIDLTCKIAQTLCHCATSFVIENDVISDKCQAIGVSELNWKSNKFGIVLWQMQNLNATHCRNIRSSCRLTFRATFLFVLCDAITIFLLSLAFYQINLNVMSQTIPIDCCFFLIAESIVDGCVRKTKQNRCQLK